MSFLKKTVVLTRSRTNGYVTFVCIGRTIGVKAVINEPFRAPLWMGIQAGSLPFELAEITERRTEISMRGELKDDDPTGIVLMDPEGAVFAYGGSYKSIDLSAMRKAIANGNGAGAMEAESAEDAEESAQSAADLIEEETQTERSVSDSDTPEVEILSAESDDNPFRLPKGEHFYRSLRPKIEELLTVYPSEPDLEKAVPDSSWVKVRYDGDDYYVVGVLREGGEVTHIAYGVPGVKAVRPPEEGKELCDFLKLKENGEGYWLMFQDAENGEMIRSEQE